MSFILQPSLSFIILEWFSSNQWLNLLSLFIKPLQIDTYIFINFYEYRFILAHKVKEGLAHPSTPLKRKVNFYLPWSKYTDCLSCWLVNPDINLFIPKLSTLPPLPKNDWIILLTLGTSTYLWKVFSSFPMWHVFLWWR